MAKEQVLKMIESLLSQGVNVFITSDGYKYIGSDVKKGGTVNA